jgi:SAM-dependent methyltransferase
MPTATVEDRAPALPEVPAGGLARSLALARAFRLEQSDPDTFYRVVAQDTLAQIARYEALPGLTVVDVGGGGGYFTEAFSHAGARSVLVEPDAGREGGSDGRHAEPTTQAERHDQAVRSGRLAPGRTVSADGYRLPFADGVADLTFSSNVLEHVADAERFVTEMVRVTRPGGLIYLSFTAWFSPWGGHETAPWHYLGGERAARRYEARHGRPPKNRYGRSLFARHVGETLRLVGGLGDEVRVLEALPRYLPGWLHWIVRVPGLREIATWNLLVVMRRRCPEATR